MVEWLNVIILIIVMALFIVLAFAVLKRVITRSFPNFDWGQWVQDSITAWRNKELDTSEFQLKVDAAAVADFFPGFDPGPDPAVKFPSFGGKETQSPTDSSAE
ncbi:MAG: hypothetical protein Q4E03_06450 [Trueperella sp.]|nr:hypothetical protein [Trueperella sp.]